MRRWKVPFCRDPVLASARLRIVAVQRGDCTVFTHGLRQYERITRVIRKCCDLSVCVCFSVLTFLDLMVAYQAALSRSRTAFTHDIHHTLIPCSTYGTLDVREQVEEATFSCGLLLDFSHSRFLMAFI